MAAVALARQFLSARTTPAHFAILQRTLQFNSLFTRAASTVAAGKAAAPKSGTKSKTAVAAKPGPKPKATATKGSTGKTTAKPAAKKTAIAKKTTAAKKPVAIKKSTAVKKPAAKKKPVAKKKPAVKKKPAAKKKPAVKKKVVAKKKKKPELTDKQKERKYLMDLRRRALNPPTKRSTNGFMFWYKQQEGKSVTDSGTIWNNFPQETKAEYERDAKATGARLAPARQKAYDDWVLSHSVDTIRDANNARRHLRRIGVGKNTSLIQDPRRVKKPSTAFIHYAKDQYSSGREITKGENGKPSVVSFTKTLRDEFANLSPEEKKRYEDIAAQDLKRYHDAMGHTQPVA